MFPGRGHAVCPLAVPGLVKLAGISGAARFSMIVKGFQWRAPDCQPFVISVSGCGVPALGVMTGGREREAGGVPGAVVTEGSAGTEAFMMAARWREIRAGSSPRWPGGEGDPPFPIRNPSLCRGIRSAITSWRYRRGRRFF